MRFLALASPVVALGVPFLMQRFESWILGPEQTTTRDDK